MNLDYTLIYRGLMVLYGLYVLLAEVVGESRLVRGGASRILSSLFILVWIAWLFVSFDVPYGWGHDALLSNVQGVEPPWLRTGVWAGWMLLAFGQVAVLHLVYRSRRAGDGLVALVLMLLLAWIISPLNNLYNVL